MENKDKKLIIQGIVEEVKVKKVTGRLLDWYYISVRRDKEGDVFTVEYEANGLEDRLLPGTKVVILAYHWNNSFPEESDEDDNPADRYVAKSINY